MLERDLTEFAELSAQSALSEAILVEISSRDPENYAVPAVSSPKRGRSVR